MLQFANDINTHLSIFVPNENVSFVEAPAFEAGSAEDAGKIQSAVPFNVNRAFAQNPRSGNCKKTKKKRSNL